MSSRTLLDSHVLGVQVGADDEGLRGAFVLEAAGVDERPERINAWRELRIPRVDVLNERQGCKSSQRPDGSHTGVSECR